MMENEYAYPFPLLVDTFRSMNLIMVILIMVLMVFILMIRIIRIIRIIRMIFFAGNSKASKEEQGRKCYNNES
jgi:hypothetical protein